MKWYSHRAAAAAAAALQLQSAPSSSTSVAVTPEGRLNATSIPHKVLVLDPVLDVRVAAWMLETDNKKVRFDGSLPLGVLSEPHSDPFERCPLAFSVSHTLIRLSAAW